MRRWVNDAFWPKDGLLNVGCWLNAPGFGVSPAIEPKERASDSFMAKLPNVSFELEMLANLLNGARIMEQISVLKALRAMVRS